MLVHACWRAEVVFGGISPASTPYELWWVLRKMQISSLVVHEELLGVLLEAVKLGPGDGELKLVLDLGKVVVLCEDVGKESVAGYRTVEALVKMGMRVEEKERKRRGGKRLAYLFQSSGTSGLPKAMMITHSNGYHSGIQTLITAAQGARFMGVEPFATHSVTLGVIPMYHSYGMILWNLRVNLVRNTTILLPKWDLELALQSIQKYRVTSLPLVPPLVRQLAQSPLTDKYDLSSVIGAVSGAAYLPPDVAYQLAQKLPQGKEMPIPSGYGLSEAASIASPTTPGIFGLEPAPPGTIGYLLPGMEGRVVDPETLEDVKKGEKGELWARGAVVTPGYFKDTKATQEIFSQPGWLRTGDLVLRDQCDRILYLDRLKEMIKVKGLQVAATEVEDTLLQCPEGLCRDACVAGVDNGRGDGSLFVRAWVVLTNEGKKRDEQLVANKLDDWVKSRLSRHKWLTGGIEVVDEVSPCSCRHTPRSMS
jgi:acyl-CoA synthetase (AMP-forming)/AMP-acid ligase II